MPQCLRGYADHERTDFRGLSEGHGVALQFSA